MKITIEPTEDQKYSTSQMPTVTIAIPGDHHDIPSVIVDLVIPALLAWGFKKSSIDEYIDPDIENVF